MSTIDWGYVEQEEAKLESNDKIIFKQKDIPNEGSVEIRFLPPWEGSRTYFKSMETVWINSKPYMSLASVGRPCPLREEIQAAKDSKDPDLKTLMEDRKKFNIQTDALYPMLIIDAAYADNGEPTSIKVNGNKVRVFSCTPATSAKLSAIVNDPKQKRAGKGMSVMHRQAGRNITIDKKAGKSYTEYSAKADPNGMDLSDAAFDAFYDNIPNMDKYLEDMAKDPVYLRAVIRNYFYGEELKEAATTNTTTTSKETPKAEGGILGDIDGLGDE